MLSALSGAPPEVFGIRADLMLVVAAAPAAVAVLPGFVRPHLRLDLRNASPAPGRPSPGPSAPLEPGSAPRETVDAALLVGSLD
ncbi:hypothetical protein [Streptomonospora wellingtoniae]|uniref:Uncharacterized protein n=1 Tax=Streptomonospora wellingtoniae TaxID=3075544 RepID=A0ABU2KTA2_9ACTN|nr:hypothetical protein [Streptomonospora sp. DSM 45055]MDT0302525.1 hypothetical protein [Streptomonospora sp. DSM 45055]